MNTTTELTRNEDVQNAKKERLDKIDYKMVTFSLAGKDYGIDIMRVKEIAKAGKFTYVPNAAPFVRGVYNLRGDIISIIDMRILFHLPAERKVENALEDLIILRVEERIFGVVVDSIDKVVGVASEAIQPPHPIFTDINVKYISGVVENASRLYIILDVERIFAQKQEEKKEIVHEAESSTPIQAPPPQESGEDDRGDVNIGFIRETLFTFRRFSVSPINKGWFERRYQEWKKLKKDGDLQLKDFEDADEYLSGFYSPYTGAFWSSEYAAAVTGAMPNEAAKNYNVWNPGCGKGFETYSIACALRKKYPESRIKIWANDSDLLNISNAPNMTFEIDDVPEDFREFLVKGKSGYSFSQVIRDMVMFEYHDVLNANPMPDVDLVVCRDLLSFLAPTEQSRVLGDIGEKLKENGFLMVGGNEEIPVSEEWEQLRADPVVLFRKKA
jgi:purine-binding chemotaxis protein CheW